MSNYAALIVRQYGEGRIAVITDRISGFKTCHGANPVTFWRQMLEWTAQRFQKEPLNIALVDNSNQKALSALRELHQIQVTPLTLQDVSKKDISSYHLIYISGLSDEVSIDVYERIESYIESGGGLFIENPNRGGENINILTSIDNVYVESTDKPLQNEAFWTTAGIDHYMYYPTAKVGFFSTLNTSSLGGEWSILMSDIETTSVVSDSTITTEITTDSQVGAEFGMSYVSSMAKGIVTIEDENPSISDITFDYLGDKIYSAEKYERIYGIFVSNPIIANSNIIRWNQMSWDATKDNDSEIFFFIKSGFSQNELDASKWSNLLINSPSDISQFTGQYIQFMIIIRCDNETFSIPKVDRVNLSYFNQETAVRFFTKAFPLDFNPKHVLLTYNAEETDDTIIRFAISGEDSANISKYQYIDPNKIETLTDISRTSENIKVMLEIVGSSETNVVVHEFALIFSGDEYSRVNKLAMESSSSSISSSSCNCGISCMEIQGSALTIFTVGGLCWEYELKSESSSSSSLDSSSSSSWGESSSSSSMGESSSSSSVDSSSSSSSSSLDSSSSSSSSLENSSSSSSSSLENSSSSSSESSEDIIYYADDFGFQKFNGTYRHDGVTKINNRPVYIKEGESHIKIYWTGVVWRMTDSVNEWYEPPVEITNPDLLYEGQWVSLETVADPAGFISSQIFSSSSES
jgi:hypothetical protein